LEGRYTGGSYTGGSGLALTHFDQFLFFKCNIALQDLILIFALPDPHFCALIIFQGFYFDKVKA